MMFCYPIKTLPCYKQMPWGGRALNEKYGKQSLFELTGESWEASSHRNGQTPAAQGRYAGMTPGELAAEFGAEFLGSRVASREFPLLFKLIDSRDKLSVQVHPDDEYAKRDNDNGKTEMWIVLDAEEGAGLWLGFKEPISRERFRECIEQNTLAEVLNFVPCKKGDVFFLRPGLVHAIGEGLIIAEIQQSSDATYRVYDWGRLGIDGKPRALHIDKALDVTDTALAGEKGASLTVSSGDCRVDYLAGCRLFGALRASGKALTDHTRGASFHILFFAEGEGVVSCGGCDVYAQKGETVIIPACAGEYGVRGDFEVYRFWVPDFEEDYLAPLKEAGYDEKRIGALFEQV
jgi:mannose-6-phosphate isomerase